MPGGDLSVRVTGRPARQGSGRYVARMVVHPPPPADLPSYIDAYREVLGTFIGTCDGLREAEWELPTACPGWTVREQVAHVLHIEEQLAGTGQDESGMPQGGVPEPVEVGAPAHVRNPLGVWTEQGVRALAHLSPAELVARLREVLQIRSAQLYSPDLDLDSLVPVIPAGEAPLGRIMQLRVSDIWVHGQDIRAAVGRPGALDSPGAAAFTAHVLRNLPDIVHEDVAPPPGTVVILESTGPVTGRAGVRIGTGQDGVSVAHPLFTGRTGEEEERPATDGVEDSVTTIALSTHELTRRAAGRQEVEETAYQVTGDEELARAVLGKLSLTP